jgi:hypothetical protein
MSFPTQNLKRLTAGLGLSLAFALSAHAASDEAFQKAFAPFMQAQAGDESAIEKAADAFTALSRAEPSNPVLMVYAGAATSQLATTTFLPWKKMGHADKGLSMIDKSLALLTPAHNAVVENNVPGVLETKFVAANTFLAVPGFMNRGPRGVALLNDVVSSPLLGSAPVGFKVNVWQRAADLASAEGRTADARKFLGLIVAAGTPQSAAAQTQLSKLAP